MSLLPPNLERKRFGILRLVVAGFVVLFVLHLLDLQVVNAGAINKVSLSNRQKPRTIEAVRGSIFDKDGNVLARSIYRYDVNVAPVNVGPVPREINGTTVTLSVDQIATQLADILQMDKNEILRKMAGTGQYANLKKKVDASTYSQIKSLDIPWIYFDSQMSRVYPNGAVAGNLLGFITADGATKAGLESKMDPCLAGVNGKETYEQGVDGIRIPDSAIVTKQAKDGGNLKLTIDTNLEYFSQQVLETAVSNERADYGTAVVVEVKTGKLLVAAEAPTVDPNNPGASIERDRQAKVFNFSYEPGSTMKTITAATAIDLGLATPLSRVVAPDKMKMLWGTWIRDSHNHKPMKLTLAGILRDSSNTGIIQIGAKVSRSKRVEYMKKFGLGAKSSLNMEGESGGMLGDTKNWDLQTDKNSMFGQGIAVTPIQMAYAYQAIANGGVRLSPKLFLGCTAADGSTTNYPVGEPVRVVSEATARSTIDMLEKVVEEGSIGRTAAVAGYRVGGKSGTAQIKQGNRYGNLYAISFIGMAPAEDPKYVVAVMLYKSRRTASSIGATPVFKQIMQQVLRAYRVPPSTTKSKNIATEWK
ncbi:MAG: peptidoglycan D,D-transpeptidase FtsI family protein [Micrococcales bacterium]